MEENTEDLKDAIEEAIQDKGKKKPQKKKKKVKIEDEESSDQIAELKAEVAEANDRYLREVAELENFKKRAIKERSEILKYAGEHIVVDILEVYDSLKLAISQETPEGAEEYVKGVESILNQFKQVLERHSIRTEDSVGEPFDPNKHEALTTVPDAEKEPGTIIEEFKSLFFFKEKLIRPAQVVVTKEPED